MTEIRVPKTFTESPPGTCSFLARLTRQSTELID
jgi:hypothetical protein